MKDLIRFTMKRQGTEAGPSWSDTPPIADDLPPGTKIIVYGENDRRKQPRPESQNLNLVYEAYRTIRARAQHKANPGLDARAAKSASRILRGTR